MRLVETSKVQAAYNKLRQQKSYLFESIIDEVNLDISVDDGMLTAGEEEYYLMAGLWAVNSIHEILKHNFIAKQKICKVLDFACGYGRVTRTLKAAFPFSEITVSDLDKKAVDTVTKTLLCKHVYGEKDLDNHDHKEKYDLIWVGSLFTHINRSYTKKLLLFLERQLSESGLLVFSTHGSHVAKRIFSKEKIYGLDEAQIIPLKDDFERDGFAFQPYPNTKDYGVSIAENAFMSKIILQNKKLSLTDFSAKGWLRHQDIYGCIKV